MSSGAASQRRNSALLEQHTSVLEVLEQPQLMDTCVRNGLFDEALELESAARARALLHADVPIIRRVSDEVSAHVEGLRGQLLSQLCGQLHLPEALRCVGYLRRLPPPHGMNEVELRSSFLRNRTLHFHQARAPAGAGGRRW